METTTIVDAEPGLHCRFYLDEEEPEYSTMDIGCGWPFENWKDHGFNVTTRIMMMEDYWLIAQSTIVLKTSYGFRYIHLYDLYEEILEEEI